MTEDDRLSPEEREALDALPRETDPDPDLRRRIHESLRAEGLVRGSHEGHSSSRGGWRRIAASIVLFAAGVGTGVLATTGSTPAGDPLAVDVDVHALHVQRLGSAYVEAVARLADEDPTADGQGREAALSSLRGAAEHLARIPGLAPETILLLTTVRDFSPPGPAGEAGP